MKKVTAYLPSLILSIILVLCFIASVAVIIVDINVTENNAVSLAEKQELTSKSMAQIEKSFKEKSGSTGIPASVYTDAIDDKYLKEVIEIYITKAFKLFTEPELEGGYDPSVPNSKLESSIDAFFNEQAEKNDYEKDEAFEDHMEQFFAYGSSVICAKLSCGEYHLVLKEENGVTLEQLKNAIEQELEIYLCGENKIDYAAVYGIPVTRFSEIKKCYEEANLLFAKRYSLEKNKITEQVKKIENEMETKETLDLGELNVSGIDRRQVEQFLYTGRKEEVSGFVDDYFRKISNGSLQSVCADGSVCERGLRVGKKRIYQ